MVYMDIITLLSIAHTTSNASIPAGRINCFRTCEPDYHNSVNFAGSLNSEYEIANLRDKNL